MTDVWLCADHHFMHRRICEYTNRPFSSVEEMDEVLIDNHNSIVKPADDVYIIGDFCFGNIGQFEQICERMNGTKYFIIGSHDRVVTSNMNRVRRVVTWIERLVEIKIDKQLVVLCHYPMLSWAKSHYGSYQLFGHHHSRLNDPYNIVRRGLDMSKRLQMDVGVDTESKFHRRFFPYHWDEIKAEMEKRNFTPINNRKR